jgi:hypothetical protein
MFLRAGLLPKVWTLCRTYSGQFRPYVGQFTLQRDKITSDKELSKPPAMSRLEVL